MKQLKPWGFYAFYRNTDHEVMVHAKSKQDYEKILKKRGQELDTFLGYLYSDYNETKYKAFVASCGSLDCNCAIRIEPIK